MIKVFNRIPTSIRLATSAGVALVFGAFALGPAIAADVSPAGADQIRQELERYVGKPDNGKPGFVSVSTDGGSYRVSFNLQHALDLIPATAATIEASPLVFSLKPLADGTWKVSLSDKEKVDYAAPAQSGSYVADGVSLDAIFDPAIAAFRTSHVGVASMHSTAASPEASAVAEISDLQQSATSTATQSGTVNIAIDETSGAIAETSKGTMPKSKNPASNVPIDVDFGISSVKSTYRVMGLRTHQLLDLWAFAVASSGKETKDAHPDYKPMLLATLPFFDEIDMNSNLNNVTVETPYGKGSIGRYGFKLGVSTQGAASFARISAQMDDLKVASAFVKEPFQSLIPTKVSFDLGAKDFDFNAGLKALIERSDFVHPDPDFAKNNKAMLTAAWLPSGKLTIDIGPSAIASPVYTLAWQGTGTFENGSGKAHIDAKMSGLDVLLKTLAQAREPGVAEALVGLYAAQALAKKNPDGTLTWAIDGDDFGVKVNGKPVGPQKKRDL